MTFRALQKIPISVDISIMLTKDEIAELKAYQTETKTKAGTEARAESVDLSSVEVVSRDESPLLAVIVDKLVRNLRSRLAKYLGRNISIDFGDIENLRHQELLDEIDKSFNQNGSFHLFKMPPLDGMALCYLDSELQYDLVDILMGGGFIKKRVSQERVISDIERKLIGKTVLEILEEFTNVLHGTIPVDLVYCHEEVVALAVSIGAPSERVIRIPLEMDFGRGPTKCYIVLTRSALLEHREKLQSQGSFTHASKQDKGRMSEHLQKAEVNLRIELARGKLTGEQALKLKVGDVLTLQTAAGDDAIVYAEDKPKFRAKVGTQSGSYAVTIKKIL